MPQPEDVNGVPNDPAELRRILTRLEAKCRGFKKRGDSLGPNDEYHFEK